MIDILTQQWSLIVIILGGIAALVAFGDKFLSLLLKLRDLTKKNQPKSITQNEVDFLHSFLRIIDEDISLNSRVSDVLERHVEDLAREIRHLHRSSNWNKILQIRMRLREYFEYSSQYEKAIEFGRAYEAALKATGDVAEARWVRVKDIGYMLILAEQHKNGREEIQWVLDNLPSPAVGGEMVELRFYAHRYIGISYLRSRKLALQSAEQSFFSAQKVIADAGVQNYPELSARIEGNFGNVALMTNQLDTALVRFEQSLRLFEQVDDVEHLGIANLRIAETLNKGIKQGGDVYLDLAQQYFSRIGWVEGVGRVHFERSLMYRNDAMASTSSEHRVEVLKRAAREIEIALQIFNGIRSGRWVGRSEQLCIEIRSASK